MTRGGLGVGYIGVGYIQGFVSCRTCCNVEHDVVCIRCCMYEMCNTVYA